MFTQAFFDLGLSEGVLMVLRIIASIGGALVGWFVCDPLTRLLYRISFRAATPSWLIPWAKIIGASSLGLAIYYFLPLGGGGGGLGWGPGMGGGPGKGVGKGGETVALNKDNKTVADKSDTKPDPALAGRHTVEIEILGGKLFEDDGKLRYYLVNRAGPAQSLVQVEAFFKENQAKILVKIVQTDDSVVFNSQEDPTRRLRNLASRYEIPTQGPKE